MANVLLRKLDKPSAWARAAESGNLDPANLATELLRELMPRPVDEGELSVFEVEEATADAAGNVAAALGFQFTAITQEKISFLAFDAQAVQGAGLLVTANLGGTNFAKVDAAHRTIRVGNLSDLTKLASIAAAATYIPFTALRVEGLFK